FNPGTATMAATCDGPGTTRIACYANPFQNKSNSQMFEGTMSYNSFNVSVIKRASRGLTFKTNYTFAKALDFNSGGSSNASTNQPKAILSPYNLALGRGIAGFSLRHAFNANFAYQLLVRTGTAVRQRRQRLVEQPRWRLAMERNHQRPKRLPVHAPNRSERFRDWRYG